MEDREIKMRVLELAAGNVPKSSDDVVLSVAQKYWEFCIGGWVASERFPKQEPEKEYNPTEAATLLKSLKESVERLQLLGVKIEYKVDISALKKLIEGEVLKNFEKL